LFERELLYLGEEVIGMVESLEERLKEVREWIKGDESYCIKKIVPQAPGFTMISLEVDGSSAYRYVEKFFESIKGEIKSGGVVSCKVRRVDNPGAECVYIVVDWGCEDLLWSEIVKIERK
jgi:hypothetical protein